MGVDACGQFIEHRTGAPPRDGERGDIDAGPSETVEVRAGNAADTGAMADE